MIEKEEGEKENKGDYFYGTVSFVVLVILSGLSHFWYIVIALCFAILFWGAAVLLIHGIRSAAQALSLRTSAARPNRYATSGAGNQVFLPGKIRQSVDG